MSIELQAQAKSRILIVDDSGMNRMMLSELLEDRYDILEASNGVEALALIRQNLSSLDLVLLDIVMQELDAGPHEKAPLAGIYPRYHDLLRGELRLNRAGL